MSNAMRRFLSVCFTNGYELRLADHQAVANRRKRNKAQAIRLIVVLAIGIAVGAIL